MGGEGIILLVIETQLAPDAAMHTRIMSIIASHLVILRISSCQPFDSISINAHDMHCCYIIGRKMCFNWLDTASATKLFRVTFIHTFTTVLAFLTSLITFLGKSA